MRDVRDATGLGMSFGTSEEGLAWRGTTLPRRLADLEVSRAMITNYCGLVEDGNPDYWRGDQAPWGLLMAWSMPAPWHPHRPKRPSIAALEIPLPGQHIINVATDTEFRRPMRIGDRPSWVDTVLDVSPAKTTRLGTGHFIHTRTDYYRVEDELAAVHTNILFRYDVSGDVGEPRGSEEPVHDVSAMPSLLPISLPVDYRRVVHNAAATWDWFPGHHNPDYARSQGQRTIYLSTLFFHGFIDRAAHEWLGPAWRPRRRRIHMHRSIYAGQTATACGRVDDTSGGCEVTGYVMSEDGPSVSFTVDAEPA